MPKKAASKAISEVEEEAGKQHNSGSGATPTTSQGRNIRSSRSFSSSTTSSSSSAQRSEGLPPTKLRHHDIAEAKTEGEEETNESEMRMKEEFEIVRSGEIETSTTNNPIVYEPKRAMLKGKLFIDWSFTTELVDHKCAYKNVSDSYVTTHTGNLKYVPTKEEYREEKKSKKRNEKEQGKAEDKGNLNTENTTHAAPAAAAAAPVTAAVGAATAASVEPGLGAAAVSADADAGAMATVNSKREKGEEGGEEEKAEDHDEYDEYNDANARTIGSIKCVLINTPAMANSGLEVFKMLDDKSADLSTVAQLIIALKNVSGGSDEVGEAELPVSDYYRESSIHGPTTRKKLVNEVGDADMISQGKTLYIDEVKVEEQYRGLGLGFMMIDQADRILNGNRSLSILIPYPLQWLHKTLDEQPWLRHDEKTQGPLPADLVAQRAADKEAFLVAQRTLMAYFAKIGYKRIELGGTVFMGRWNGFVAPDLAAVCPHLFTEEVNTPRCTIS